MVAIQNGYTIGELIGDRPEIKILRRDGKEGTYVPPVLRNFSGIFVNGEIEDYRLAKLSVLVENNEKPVNDLENLITARLACIPSQRTELTEMVYSYLIDFGTRRAYYGSERYFSKKLASLIREGEIEDLAQESALKAIKGVDSYSPTTAFRYWYGTIVKNNILDLIRKRVNNKYKNFSDLFPEITIYVEAKLADISRRTDFNFNIYLQDPLYVAVSNETMEKINASFSALPKKYRDVMGLDLLGVDHKVAATLTSNSEANYRVILYRARQAMGAFLEFSGISLPGDYRSNMTDTMTSSMNSLEKLLKKGSMADKKKLRKISQRDFLFALFRETRIRKRSAQEFERDEPATYHGIGQMGLLEVMFGPQTN